jgi:hypothetical protein
VPSKKAKLPLSKTHPKLAKEAVGWDPSTVTKGSNKKYQWKCSKEHLYEMSPNTRTGQDAGCPYCSGRRVLAGFNDLATTHPKLAKEADRWDPKTVGYGSTAKKMWKCDNEHLYESSPNARTSNQSGCPYCTNRKVLSGFNDLKTTNPDLSSEADGWDPTKYSAGMANVMSWCCQLGHKWKAAIYSRAGGQRGCPVCSNQIVLAGFNDLKTTNPELADEAIGWDPRTVISGSNKNFRWKCSLGHIFEATISNRKSGKGSQCPFCTNRKVLVGFNDLATIAPEVLEYVDGWDPKSFTAHSDSKKSWKCEYGHRWTAQIKSLTLGTRCASCAKHGFNPGKKGYLYFIHNYNLDLLQIGITNDMDRRIREHKRSGWEVIEIRGPMDGLLTKQWESAILRMLKAKGADLSNSKIAGKFDGYSEAWSKSTFEVKSIKELMRLTEEFEEK